MPHKIVLSQQWWQVMNTLQVLLWQCTPWSGCLTWFHSLCGWHPKVWLLLTTWHGFFFFFFFFFFFNFLSFHGLTDTCIHYCCSLSDNHTCCISLSWRCLLLWFSLTENIHHPLFFPSLVIKASAKMLKAKSVSTNFNLANTILNHYNQVIFWSKVAEFNAQTFAECCATTKVPRCIKFLLINSLHYFAETA